MTAAVSASIVLGSALVTSMAFASPLPPRLDMDAGVWTTNGSAVSRRPSGVEVATEFLNGLINARDVLPLTPSLAFVLEPPNLLLARDVDGDGRADERRVVGSGLVGGEALILTSDGWLMATGTRVRFGWDGERLERSDDRATPLPVVAIGVTGDLLEVADGELRLWAGDPIRFDHGPREGRLGHVAHAVIGVAPPGIGAATLAASAPASEAAAESTTGEIATVLLADPSRILKRPASGWRWTLEAAGVDETGAPAPPNGGSRSRALWLVARIEHGPAATKLVALEELLVVARESNDAKTVGEPLVTLAKSHPDPVVRRLAWCALERLDLLSAADRQAAASDLSPLVRRWARAHGADCLQRRLADPTRAFSLQADVDAAIDATLARADEPRDGRAERRRVELVQSAVGHESLLLERLLAKLDRLGSESKDDDLRWQVSDLVDRALGGVVAGGSPDALRRLLEQAAERADAGDAPTARILAQAAFAGTNPLARRHAIVRLDRAPLGYAELLASDVGAEFRSVDAWMRWPDRADVPAPSLATTPEETIELGRRVYSACMTCHGPAGRGQDGVYPPLAASPYVNGDPERFAKILLHGLKGKVQVGTKEVVGVMPRPQIETDEEIAAVMTYVRQAFGNAAPPVDASLVRAVRARHERRAEPWDVAELEESSSEKGAAR